MGKIDLSVVVPLYNEEECVELLYERIVDALHDKIDRFEIIFVDDGSGDGTFEVASKVASADTRVRIVKFRRNYGQTAAMSAGINHGKGDVIITMDGDLQNDPADIPKFLEKIEEGFDIVCGWRHKRQDKLISRKIPSMVANWIIGKITGVPIKDNGCSLKAYRREVIQSIPLYSDMHRFIPAMTTLAGTRITEIKVNHHPRTFGVSKYGISRIYKVIIDLLVIKTIVSFVSRPLHLFGALGIGSSIVGISFLLFSLLGFFTGKGDIDFMTASGGLLFMILTCFLFLVGILCELTVKTGELSKFSEVKRLIH